MIVHYEHHLHTGSGWTKAILSLSDDSIATTYFDSRWMYPGVKRYRITWSHTKLSEAYGLLKLYAIERYTSLDSDVTVIEYLDQIFCEPDFDEERRAFYRSVTYEYILLPKSEVWIPDDMALDEMRAMGYADWHERFDLVLLLHFSVAMLDGRLERTDVW